MKYLDKVKLLFLVIILIADGRISVWSQEIRELTFSNISSRSVVVSWLTDEAVSSQVEYGQTLALGQIREDLILKKQHRLDIDGLVPDSQYYFTVTVDDTTISGITQTAKVGAGVPYTLYGQLITSTQQPLSGALVTISVTNNIGTSSRLTSVSNNSGFWNVNLGNLKVTNTGAVFNHQSGNQLSILVRHLPDIVSNHQQIRSGSSPQKIILPEFVVGNGLPPQKIGLIEVGATGTITLDLSPGWNMIALPGNPNNPDPQSLIGSSQTFLLPFYYWEPDGFSYKPVTQLVLGQSYWVLSINPAGERIVLPVELASSYTIQLKAGWNMIGSVAKVVDFSDPMDSPDQSVLPGTLYEWSADGFTYKPTTYIQPGKGYWVLTLQNCELTVSAE